MNKLALLMTAGAAAIAAPALADADAAGTVQAHHSVKLRMTMMERGNYREIFDAIRASDWSSASARLDAMGDGSLQDVARAELYLAKGSPKVALDRLMALIARAPDLPQSAQLARLAEGRGAEMLPMLPEAKNLVGLAGQPRRVRARSVKGDSVADQLEPLVQPRIVDDQPGAAEALLSEREFSLSREALTEFQQRIAWSYYLTGDEASALRLADKARAGSGEWALQGEWVAGLAAWRMRDCNIAADRFSAVGARSGDVELMAAGHYWAARADMMCARPERVQSRLRSAARLTETFYGLLAQSALGVKTANPNELHDYRDAEWRAIAAKPNVKAAIGLAEIGERNLADEMIKHQVRISPADHDAMIHLASDLNLAGTQVWLAHNAPRGAKVNPAARYPAPDWKPTGGWRVDPSLVFAHALQESNFRTQVVSPAGAVGLLQVRPGTAGDIARSRGQSFDRAQLTEPASNIEYGQSYLEYLRDYRGTGGLLPKVIAAYNAGPGPVVAWNTRYHDQTDPLLYIESIPYWETRGYVPIILRNYWVYEGKAGRGSTSRAALAQGMWPRFPGLPGATAIRMTPPTHSASFSAR